MQARKPLVTEPYDIAVRDSPDHEGRIIVVLDPGRATEQIVILTKKAAIDIARLLERAAQAPVTAVAPSRNPNEPSIRIERDPPSQLDS